MSSLFFGKSKPKPKPKADSGQALQTLNSTIEMMEKKEAHLEAKVLGMKKEAAALHKSKRATDKKKAMQILRNSKMYETQLQQTAGQMQNLVAQKMAVEGMALTQQVVSATQAASEAMNAGMDLDRMEEIVADAQEGMERVQDITNALSTPMDSGMEPIDDDDLMAELDELAAEQDEEDGLAVDMASLEVPSGPIAGAPTAADILADAPSVPATFAAPTPAAAVADQELADLMAFAN